MAKKKAVMLDGDVCPGGAASRGRAGLHIPVGMPDEMRRGAIPVPEPGWRRWNCCGPFDSRLLWLSRAGGSRSHRSGFPSALSHGHVSSWVPPSAAVSDLGSMQGAICRCWYLL